MLKKILFIVLSFCFAGKAYSQELRDNLNKIDLKLRKDKTYLNINYISVASEPKLVGILTSVPRIDGREAFTARSGENVSYMITFLKEGFATDSLLLLYVSQITTDSASSSGFFGAVDGGKTDTAMVVSFKDMYTLKFTNNRIYKELYTYVNGVLQNDVAETPNLLKIQPDTDIKTGLGLSRRDNEDYINFARINSIHYYPENKALSVLRSKRQKEESAPLKIDASLSDISFAHEKMNFTLEGASLELSVSEKVINLLPWQNMSLSGSFRTLFNLNGAKNVNEIAYMDARFGARFRMNTAKFADNGTFIISEKPMLNFTNALITELHFTRPLTLPFINLYFALGWKNFENPYVSVQKNNEKLAYFTTSQAEFTMSFYWNTSDKKTNRFRMDIGAGYYDRWNVIYDSVGNVKNSKMEKQKIDPVIALHYNFVPENNPLLGGSLRVFDCRLSMLFWLKIVEFSPINTIRFELHYLGSPFARTKYEWENDGGVMLQLRYRYGI